MRLRDYFGLILKSLNPNKHRDLVKMPFFDLVKYFSFLVLLGLVASIFLLLPMVSQYQDSLQEELSEFEQFQVNLNVSLNQTVTVFEKPKIVVDFSRDELGDEWILFNNESFMYKKFFFFGEKSRDFADYKSVKSEKSVDFYTNVILFLLPAVLFWIGVFFVVKAGILMGIFSLFGYLFFMSSKNQVTIQKAMKASIFAATPMVLLDLVLWPIKVMYFIPVFIYLIYFIIALIMVSDRKYKKEG